MGSLLGIRLGATNPKYRGGSLRDFVLGSGNLWVLVLQALLGARRAFDCLELVSRSVPGEPVYRLQLEQ